MWSLGKRLLRQWGGTPSQASSVSCPAPQSVPTYHIEHELWAFGDTGT